MALLIGVVVLLLAGMARASAVGSLGDDWSTVAGMVTGSVTSVVLFAVLARYARRRLRRNEED
jgi:membrane protein implicated in regulation of membrane protease activity